MNLLLYENTPTGLQQLRQVVTITTLYKMLRRLGLFYTVTLLDLPILDEVIFALTKFLGYGYIKFSYRTHRQY